MKAQSEYEEKLQSGTKVAEKTMFALAWKVQELEDLSKHATQLVVDMQTLAEKIQGKHYDFVIGNVAKSLTFIHLDEAKRLSKQQRTVVTHMTYVCVDLPRKSQLQTICFACSVSSNLWSTRPASTRTCKQYCSCHG